jgi:primase-polymerase (primpol)-like protein
MTTPDAIETHSILGLDAHGEQSLSTGPTNDTERPRALPVIVDTIPERLKIGQPYVVWRYSWRPGKENGPGKWDKPPLVVRTLRPVAVTDPKGWATFEEAVAVYCDRSNDLDGIGLVLHRDQGDVESLVAWDLDNCRDPITGSIESQASDLVRELDTYAEISPSGRGVRVFCHGQLPPRGRKKGRVECYDHARYVTVTGHRLAGAPTSVNAPGPKLLRAHEYYWPTPKLQVGGSPRNVTNVNTKDDARLILRILQSRNRELFVALWDALPTHHASPSEGDLALCGTLAYWCGSDPLRIDRLFRQSRRMRPKWDERRGTETYGQRTVRQAVEGLTHLRSWS